MRTETRARILKNTNKGDDDQSISRIRERSRNSQFSSKDNYDVNRVKVKKETFSDKRGKEIIEGLQLEKKQRKEEAENKAKADKQSIFDNFPKEIVVQFVTADGVELGGSLTINSEYKKQDLNVIMNKLLKELKENHEIQPYIFMVEDNEILNSLKDILLKLKHSFSSEKFVKIVYHPESLFSVKPLTRGGTSMEGHTDSILACHFSPCSRFLATAGGDSTIRIWDMQTFTSIQTLDVHNGWVLNVMWSPCGDYLASGSVDGHLAVFKLDNKTQKMNIVSRKIKAHNKWITSLTWKPLHLIGNNVNGYENGVEKTNTDNNSMILLTSSKDGFVKAYNADNLHCVLNFQAHNEAVSKVIWSGENYIYTVSQDKTLKQWNSKGQLISNHTGHAHWINTMAMSTEFITRTGCYDYENINNTNSLSMDINFNEICLKSLEEKSNIANLRYKKLKNKLSNNNKIEKIVTGSDDYTLFLWDPLNESSKKPIRLTGHQGLVNHVMFSPDTMFIASASFDKCIKIWNGNTGTFLFNFRGHVQSVYQISWSADSKYIVSASKDSTLKLWNVKSDKKDKSCKYNLPGHADEVYCVDWSPSGESAASGSKDQRVNVWRH